jgi:hypothetical protein
MATYTDIDDLRQRFYAVQDDEVKEKFLNRAAILSYNYINSALNGIYGVPFTGTFPVEIVDISDILTRHWAQALQLKQTIIFERTEATGDLKSALDWLSAIIKGSMSLVGQTRLTTRGPVHTMDGYEPIFHVDDAEFHEPDTDLLDKISDDRE